MFLTGNASLLLRGHSLIFFLRFRGKKNPQCVDTQGQSEWDINQCNDAEHYSKYACPRLALPQSYACADSKRRFQDEKHSYCDKERLQEPRNLIGHAFYMAEITENDCGEYHDRDAAHQIEQGVHNPQDAQDLNMMGDAVDGTGNGRNSDGLTAGAAIL